MLQAVRSSRPKHKVRQSFPVWYLETKFVIRRNQQGFFSVIIHG